MQILYFAWVREKIGLDAEAVNPPDDVKTAAELIDWLSQKSAGHAEALADITRLRIALDQAFARPDTSIGNTREVAIFPPVTGG